MARMYTTQEVASLLDSSFQGDSGDDDFGFEVEECINPLYFGEPQGSMVNNHNK